MFGSIPNSILVNGHARKVRVTNQIQTIPIDKLEAHPDNPNEMSRANFAKLVRNIERTSRYEPLIVRPSPQRRGCFQIINGHHRWRVLAQLGYKTVDVVAWDIDDEQTDILLATLNRLGGSDDLGKKLKLLKRLSRKMAADKLAKLLPQTAKQIERLTSMLDAAKLQTQRIKSKNLANPLVFFVSDRQQQTIEQALSLAREKQDEKTKAAKNAAALTCIAECFLENSKTDGARRCSEIKQELRP